MGKKSKRRNAAERRASLRASRGKLAILAHLIQSRPVMLCWIFLDREGQRRRFIPEKLDPTLDAERAEVALAIRRHWDLEDSEVADLAYVLEQLADTVRMHRSRWTNEQKQHTDGRSVQRGS